MPLHPKEIESVLGREGPEGYKYFIKRVVDSELVWGLYCDGWALAEADGDSIKVFPLWPYEEYAAMCAKQKWRAFVPRAISLNELLDELFPSMSEEGILPGVFWRPDG